jgi:acyl-CoA synthetase (AMP-forming)/AMP-acid ligase II
MRIEQWLVDSAHKFGAKTALVTPQRPLTYREFNDASTRLEAALAERGVKRGDRVLVFMDNCWEAAVSIFAILKAGATFSPINSSTKADKLAYVIGNCRATAILTTGKLMPVVEEARHECDSPLTIIATAVEAGALPAGVTAFEDCLAHAPETVRHKGIAEASSR